MKKLGIYVLTGISRTSAYISRHPRGISFSGIILGSTILGGTVGHATHNILVGIGVGSGIFLTVYSLAIAFESILRYENKNLQRGTKKEPQEKKGPPGES